MPDDLVKCEPEELVFEGPPSESSSVTLTVHNTSPRDVIFKVKTNSPMRYVVTPNEDIIKARETKLIKGKVSFLDSKSSIFSPFSFNSRRCRI